MQRWAALGLLTLLSGCASPGGGIGFLPVFRSDPPALSLLPPLDGQLAGADSNKVGLLLGKPDLVRRDGPAEIWHYAGDECRLLVFLYDEAPADLAQAVPAPALTPPALTAPALSAIDRQRAERRGVPGLTKANLALATPIGNGIVRHVAVWPAAAPEAGCVDSVAKRARTARGNE